MARVHHTPCLAQTEEALTVLFCLVDDTYALLNPRGRHYESLKRLSDSQVIALALFQQLRGVESERSFLRDAERFFAHLLPGVVGLHPSSFNRHVKKLRRFLEPLRQDVVSEELVGEPETLIVDLTLLPVLHPRQVGQQSAGFERAAWVKWGSFLVYGVKLCTSLVRNQPGTPLLRAHRRQRRRGAPGRGALRRRPRLEAPGGPRLPQRGVRGGDGRGGGSC